MQKAPGFIAIVVLFTLATSAFGLTPQDYRRVEVSLPPNAAAPLGTIVTDEHRHRQRLGELISKPAVLVFADYTCTTLCGPIVAFVASALERSGLQPGRQFQLIIIGLDPKDQAADAVRMRHEHLGPDEALNRASMFVTADAESVQRLTEALGYRYVYDREHDQFVHPGAAYVLRSDGHVARVLTGLGLSAGDLRLALVEASEGRIGTFSDQVRLLCSGFDPRRGIYNLMVSRVLMLTGLAAAFGLGGLIGLLMLTSRRRVT